MAMMGFEDDARSKLLAYCSLINENYETPPHIATIARMLEAAERGEKKRVIVEIPPRHGKSMLCSQYFPAWYLGRNPDKYIITATYAQELADDYGRKVRDLLTDPWYPAIFPETKLRQDTRSASRMETTLGGTYVSAGVGGPITGRGAHLFLIDDPVKNREEADSQTMREKLWEWYKAVAYTRMMPGNSAIVIIMTRWHEEDLIGKVLSETAHENWEVIRMPAEDGGKALWPERYPLEVLENIKKTLNVYDWSCLYMQEPVPKEGVIFKREWMRSGLEDEYRVAYAGVDPAISQKTVNDETAISIWGLGWGDHPAAIDELETLHGHWNFQTQLEVMKDIYVKYREDPKLPNIDTFIVEDVAYQRSLGEALVMLGIPCQLIKTDGDKVRRAMSVSHLFSQGRVRVNTPELIKQLLSLRGKDEKNDLADAAVYALQYIHRFSMESTEKPEDRYAGLDPRSKQFWMDHFEEKEQERGVGANLASLING